MKYIIGLLFLTTSLSLLGQVKIGDSPSQINQNSLLELESTNKVLVLSRVTTTQMNAISPLNGSLVYNIEEQCIFFYEGTNWKSLCNSSSREPGVIVTTRNIAPSFNNPGDFWIDNSSARYLVNLWDGATWIPLNDNPKSGVGAPNSTLIQNPIAGDIYVDEATGSLFTYNGTAWINTTGNGSSTVNNGINKNSDNVVQLGGALIKSTEITTDRANTLAIIGLEDAVENDETEIVVVEKNTGILKKISSSNLFQEEVILIIAEDNQSQFNTPLPITNSKKVNVYRNGVRISFTAINSNTIELEPEAICYQNDEIRIVQFH